jgi:NHL repeat.
MRAAEAGVITTVVGTGEKGHDGDGGPAARARIDSPFTVAFDRNGHLLFTEAGTNCVRRVDGTGRISTVYGPTTAPPEDVVAIAAGFSDGPPDAFCIAERLSKRVRLLPEGREVNAAVPFREPHDVCSGGPMTVYVADVAASKVYEFSVDTGRVRRTLGTGRKAFAGDGGPAAEASYQGARAVAAGPGGVLYIIEREGHRVRRVAANGVVTTIAGTGTPGYEGDGGPALRASFRGPKGGCVDPKTGDLFVVDTENHAIRKIDGTTGIITTFAGGRKGGGGDGGPAERAELGRPHGVAVGPDGALYIADTENHRVRRVALR